MPECRLYFTFVFLTDRTIPLYKGQAQTVVWYAKYPAIRDKTLHHVLGARNEKPHRNVCPSVLLAGK